MKKVFALSFVTAMIALASCGGSNEQTEEVAVDSVTVDSVALDSIVTEEVSE